MMNRIAVSLAKEIIRNQVRSRTRRFQRGFDERVHSVEHGVESGFKRLTESSGTPDRDRALALGMIGGLIGAIIAYWFDREYLDKVLPSLKTPLAAPLHSPDPIEDFSPFPRQYRPDEDAVDTEGRLTYGAMERMSRYLDARGMPPLADTRDELEQWVSIGYGILWGAAYGGSRNTTRARDIAGAFFYGIRLWLFDVTVRPFIGTRPGPTKYTLAQHVRLMLRLWAYTLPMTGITRGLYRIVTPIDWL